jgi:hypothetical protein
LESEFRTEEPKWNLKEKFVIAANFSFKIIVASTKRLPLLKEKLATPIMWNDQLSVVGNRSAIALNRTQSHSASIPSSVHTAANFSFKSHKGRNVG